MMTVTLTINGQKVTTPEGSNILEASRGAGIHIPSLCHHPDLTNVGACRMCVVSVDKARGLQTACTTPVSEGMVVETESEEARATRKFVLEMLLSDHPNECMTCEVNGDCQLQDLAYDYDVTWPEHSGTRHTYEIDPDPNPFVYIDRNKCILCGRCVRACNEIQNRDVWNFAHRGFRSKLVAGADQFMLDAGCESCGQCVAYCPVGALHDKMSVGLGRANQVKKVRTTCSYCGYDYVHHPDRLQRPLVRARWLNDVDDKLDSGEWQVLDTAETGTAGGSGNGRGAGNAGPDTFIQTDWDTALDVVATKFVEEKRTHGSDCLAVLTSAKCTNEENYLANKFTRQVLGTNTIDHCARL